MQVIEAILTRRSIRKFKDKEVARDQVETLLKSAMAAPSAINEQPWHFVVVNDREQLKKMSSIHKGTSQLAGAPMAIMICGEPALEQSPGSWIYDCTGATVNILLTAHSLGLGSVWTSIYPNQSWVEAFRSYIELPENVVPFVILPIGYPDELKEPEDRYRSDRIHWGKW